MLQRIVLIVTVGLMAATCLFAQNTNSSTTTTERPRTNTNRAPAKSPGPTDTTKPAVTSPATRPKQPTPVVKPAAAVPGSAAVVAAFNALLDGIRHANVKEVSGVYLNSPRLILFNNNGTVTRGWEQMRKNRESSYPDLKDVKLDVKDLSITMLGTGGAVVSCLWTQSQTYKDVPETASGRMTLVFKRVGKDWKAVHLHTSPDKEDPSRVLPSENAAPTPSPSPNP